MDASKRSSRFGGLMTEPTNQTAMIQNNNETVTLPTPGKRRSSALDRGFPSGKILLGLAALIILLQGIAAWKVVNLEQEKATVTRLRALLEKDIKNYEYLTRELPGLKREWGETEANIRHLQGEVTALEKQRAGLKAELPELEKRTQELRAASEQSEATRSALDKTSGALKGEIHDKTSEVSQLKQDIENLRTQQNLVAKRKSDLDGEVKKLDIEVSKLQTRRDVLEGEITRLTGPSSDLAKGTENLKIILDEIKKSPTMIEASINQISNGFNGQIIRMSQENDKLKAATSDLNSTIQRSQQTWNALNQSSTGLSQALSEF
jgi:chromosome segregation ATPase